MLEQHDPKNVKVINRPQMFFGAQKALGKENPLRLEAC